MSLWMHFGMTCGVDPRGGLHAVRTPRRKTRRKTWDAACGKRVRLLGFPIKDQPDSGMTVVWPPYVDQAREWGFERCRDCMAAVGGKPQRPQFADEAAS
jgi:hypothetical protein